MNGKFIFQSESCAVYLVTVENKSFPIFICTENREKLLFYRKFFMCNKFFPAFINVRNEDSIRNLFLGGDCGIWRMLSDKFDGISYKIVKFPQNYRIFARFQPKRRSFTKILREILNFREF